MFPTTPRVCFTPWVIWNRWNDMDGYHFHWCQNCKIKGSLHSFVGNILTDGPHQVCSRPIILLYTLFEHHKVSYWNFISLVVECTCLRQHSNQLRFSQNTVYIYFLWTITVFEPPELPAARGCSRSSHVPRWAGCPERASHQSRQAGEWIGTLQGATAQDGVLQGQNGGWCNLSNVLVIQWILRHSFWWWYFKI